MHRCISKICPRLVSTALLAASCLYSADPFFLRRSLSDIQPRGDDLTLNANGVSYKPVFGIGDKDVDKLQSVARYGELTVGPGGSSAVISYPAEEQIYYVLEGHGTLLYEGLRVPVKKDDFMYLPINVKHGMANTSNTPVRVIVMGYKIPAGRHVAPTPRLLLANANNVQAQVLPTHGPTTQFKLLMGHHQPQPDKVTAASVMISLYIMDFAPGGTNIPHIHATEEEIYLLMRGHGGMVAGKLADGQDARRPSKEGDVFFFGPNTRVGYYSGAKEGPQRNSGRAFDLPSAGGRSLSSPGHRGNGGRRRAAHAVRATGPPAASGATDRRSGCCPLNRPDRRRGGLHRHRQPPARAVCLPCAGTSQPRAAPFVGQAGYHSLNRHARAVCLPCAVIS